MKYDEGKQSQERPYMQIYFDDILVLIKPDTNWHVFLVKLSIT